MSDDRVATVAEFRIGCMTRMPAEEAARRGLFLEADAYCDLAALSPAQAERLISVHAPYMFPEGWPRKGRVNIAALDAEWRRLSMACLRDCVEQAARFPTVRQIVLHCGPRRWRMAEGAPPEPVGDYELLIASLQELAHAARALRLQVLVENNRTYCDAVPKDCAFGSVPFELIQDCFATMPAEWLQIRRDVARENLRLCLDTSHATTCSHRCDTPADRPAILSAFLAEPAAIGHVHWNDNDPWHVDGREDRHLPIGSSGLGDAFHRIIRALPVTKLLEHFTDLPTLDGELEYIKNLGPARR